MNIDNENNKYNHIDYGLNSGKKRSFFKVKQWLQNDEIMPTLKWKEKENLKTIL